MIVFDIETAPLPDEQLREFWTPPEIPPPAPFDPSSVKVGHLKDQAKIDEKIATAREKAEAEIANHDANAKQQIEDSFATFRDRAALDAVFGTVLCIGYYWLEDGEFTCAATSEEVLLSKFWKAAGELRELQTNFVGVNIFDFDLPFLMRRSWILGIEVPHWVLKQNRYWDPVFVDLREVWLAGQRGGQAKSSFDYLAAAFGTAGKPRGVTGAQFAELWTSDRETALKYLESDVRQPAIWAERMWL